MIDKQRIMDETHGGLDILLDLFPQARRVVEGKAKKFSIREGDKTPSVGIRQSPKSGYWVINDFGDDAREKNAIDAWMEQHTMDRSRFGAAVQLIAQEYGIVDELSDQKNRKRIVERDARPEEKEGEWYWEISQEGFTDLDLKILGPGVTRETCERLHWYKLEWLGKVKNRRIKEGHSTDTYPIFMRECLGYGTDEGKKFYKIYRPLEPDKGFRFMYLPVGAKLPDYINGFYELQQAWARLRKEAADQQTDEDREKKEPLPKNVSECKREIFGGVQRYYRVVLCSGERDALCVAARGDFPVWLNSETATLDTDDYWRIIKVAGQLHNIPDLDATGIRAGSRLALKLVDLQTVWLPMGLRQLKDNRGRGCKDFRDWCAFYPTQADYFDLMGQAAPARFWTTETTKAGNRRHRIDVRNLHNFLRLNGFYILKDASADDDQLIRLKDGVVYAKRPRDVRDFVRRWALNAPDPDVPGDRGLRTDTNVYIEHSVINLILTDVAFTPAYLSALPDIELDFTTATPTTQRFHFRNGLVLCSAAGYEMTPWREADPSRSVWSDDVVPHDFRKLPAMFTATERTDLPAWPDKTPRFDLRIEPEASKSCFFGYLINSSRLHWRKEVEESFPGNPEAQQAYLDLHRFDIAGEHLTDAEIEEQKMCLLNKIFTLGYLMHAYKDPSRTWASYAMDYRISDASQANGRSGKSFFLKALDILNLRSTELSGRNDHLLDNQFLYARVTPYTRLIRVDDLSQRIQVQSFYDVITASVIVNAKGKNEYVLPYSKSPKFAFSTNYVPSDFDPSSDARLLYNVFGDYYHQRTPENPQGYQETRTVRDDFQKNLFDEYYGEDEWNADFNFLMQCETFYLSLCRRPVKILPPMANIITRKLMAEMGADGAFQSWAEVYFSEDSGHLDTQVCRKDAFQDYVTGANKPKTTMQTFSRQLKAFARWAPWISELNPQEMLNSQGRNVKSERDELGRVVTVEYIYLRSVAASRQFDAIWNAP